MQKETEKPDSKVDVLKGIKLTQYPWGYVAEKSGVIVGSQTLAAILELLNRAIHNQKL